MASFSMAADKQIGKSHTNENDQQKRSEKKAPEECEQKQNLTPTRLSVAPETRLCNTRTCYLLTKSNNPVTIENSIAGPSTANNQMSVIKLTSSKDNPVFICCFGAKTKQLSTVNNPISKSQTGQLIGNAFFINTSPPIISQSNANAVVETSTIDHSQETKTNQHFASSNQQKVGDHTIQNNQTDTSPLAGNLSATNNASTIHGGDLSVTNDLVGEQDMPSDIHHESTVTGNLSATNDASTIHAGNLSVTNDAIGEQDIPSDIHHECTTSQIGHSKPSTIHTVCHTTKDEQIRTSPVASNLLSVNVESDDGLSKVQGTPSDTYHECKTSQTEKQPFDFQTQEGTMHHFDGVSDKDSTIHNHCKPKRTDDAATQLGTMQESVFQPVSKLGIVENCFFKADLTSINDHHQSKNDQTDSPSTPETPYDDLSTTNTKQSPPKDCYLATGSWDPSCHHIEYHEKSTGLPHDLRYIKESELFPMAYGDFTKCLEDEDLCSSTLPNMLTSADDDGVVPSSSPLLPGDGGRCYSTYSDTSTDGSEEYAWECYSARNENIYKSPSRTYADYPQYGTLNWGLAPTIIYKTPEPDTSLQDVGDDYMKCSISAGNVELLTPPPPNYKKLLRRSRRRMKRRHVKKRRIHFGSNEHCQGLQEVPVNEIEKGNEQFLDTDFVPDDPMWFEDKLDELDDGNSEPFSVSEQDIADCYDNLRNTVPKIEETTDTILVEAVEYIKNLEETLDGFSHGENVEITNKGESDNPTVLKSFEDILEILPKYSWNELDEASYEIQKILDNLNTAEEANMDGCCEELPLTELQEGTKDEVHENSIKRKRKCRKSYRKQNVSKKQKKSSDINNNQSQCDDTKSSAIAECYLDNSNSQRSDCDSVSISEDNVKSNSSSRSNSQGSRCVTPKFSKPTPGVLLSPSVTGFIPLQTIGKPLILPKPPCEDDRFPPTSLQSPLTSPQSVPSLRMVPTACPEAPPILPQFFQDITKSRWSQWLGSVIKVPARRYSMRTRNKEKIQEGPQKKTIPNGYMLYCKKKRNSVLKDNPDLQSKPGDITKLLSENWNQLSEVGRRPYVEEAIRLRNDENEWINQTP